jgi:hypothetical protein
MPATPFVVPRPRSADQRQATSDHDEKADAGEETREIGHTLGVARSTI